MNYYHNLLVGVHHYKQMVFALIAEVVAEVMVLTFSMYSEVSSALGGRSDLPGMISEANKAQAEGIRQTHGEYEKAAEEERQRKKRAQQAPMVSSSSVSLCVSCSMGIMMLMMAAPA